ncbi:hypothetical protein CCYA_CCYA13G3525 [Cyanidiococcus yangmingshanensis]|nr:hypothetical protein CCYA_CCYA13G3525 [Cyanidiococcus yangmingshanensis]
MDAFWSRAEGGNGLEYGTRQRWLGDLGREPASTRRLTSWIRNLDVYPKTVEDVRLRTVTGGLIALVSYLFIGILVVAEFLRWLRPQLRSNVLVDARSVGDKDPITVTLGIDLLSLDCDEFTLDALTVSGVPLPDSVVELNKRPLDRSGGPVRPPRGAHLRAHRSEKRVAQDQTIEAGQEWDPKTQRVAERVSPQVYAQLQQYRQEAMAFRNQLAELDKAGKPYCGSCFGTAPAEAGTDAENRSVPLVCCNTCDEIRARYNERNWSFEQVLRTAEQCAEKRYQTLLSELNHSGTGGCRVFGRLQLPRVAGNFHLAPGKGHTHRMGQHIHAVDDQLLHRTYNFSHRILYLHFGPLFPHQKNPLDGTVRILQEPQPGSPFGNMVQYYCKLVPATYSRSQQNIDVLRSMEYAAADLTQSSEQDRAGVTHSTGSMPGIFFFYEPQPLQIAYFEGREYGFLHFIVQLCAIVGGVFTVSGMIDRLVFGAGTMIRAQKRRLGKLG